MELNDFIKQLEDYYPIDNKEKKVKKKMLKFINKYKLKCFDRFNKGHFTSSAIIVSQNHKYMLMAYHNIYKTYAWLGGHADGEVDLEKVARKESFEEANIDGLKLLKGNISSIEILKVKKHIKNNIVVKSHYHYNVTYLFEGDLNQSIKPKLDENSSVKWIEIKDIKNVISKEKHIFDIYKKSLSNVYDFTNNIPLL